MNQSARGAADQSIKATHRSFFPLPAEVSVSCSPAAVPALLQTVAARAHSSSSSRTRAPSRAPPPPPPAGGRDPPQPQPSGAHCEPAEEQRGPPLRSGGATSWTRSFFFIFFFSCVGLENTNKHLLFPPTSFISCQLFFIYFFKSGSESRTEDGSALNWIYFALEENKKIKLQTRSAAERRALCVHPSPLRVCPCL